MGTATSLSNTNITTIRSNCFRGMTSLQTVDFPNCATINGASFYQCSGLTAINFPNATTLAQNAFSYCTSLETVVLPKVTSTFNTIFNGCTSLKKFDLLGSLQITSSNFQNDAMLNLLIIRKTSILGLGNVNAFTGTPFANGGTGGTIYIPKALYDHLGDGTSSDYQSATNWSTIYGYGTITWAKIEGSQYENYYADGTPIS